MRSYVDFDTCTLQALRYVGASFGVTLSAAHERALLDAYLRLPAFPEVRSALAKLQRAGYRLVALTNGTERSVRALLENAALGEYLEAVLSVERVRRPPAYVGGALAPPSSAGVRSGRASRAMALTTAATVHFITEVPSGVRGCGSRKAPWAWARRACAARRGGPGATPCVSTRRRTRPRRHPRS